MLDKYKPVVVLTVASQAGARFVSGLVLVRQFSTAALLAGLVACGDHASVSIGSLQTATFIGIGFLPGGSSSQALAVSGDGLMVAGSAKLPSGKSQAVRWSAPGGMQGLGLLPGGTFSEARGISSDGSVIVGNGDAPATSGAAFLWHADSGMVQLTPPANSSLCAAAGISGNGQEVVGTCLVSGNYAFRWTAATGMVGLRQFGTGSNHSSIASAISFDGTTVAGMGHPVLTGAVIWAANGDATILGPIPGDEVSAALALSRDGSVVAGYSIDPLSHQRAFRWTRQTGMLSIAPLPDTLASSTALGVSADGKVIVGWGIASDREVAMIWEERFGFGMRQLETVLRNDYQTDISGWKLARATGISQDGRTIVGIGTNPNGQDEGWVVRIRD